MANDSKLLALVAAACFGGIEAELAYGTIKRDLGKTAKLIALNPTEGELRYEDPFDGTRKTIKIKVS